MSDTSDSQPLSRCMYAQEGDEALETLESEALHEVGASAGVSGLGAAVHQVLQQHSVLQYQCQCYVSRSSPCSCRCCVGCHVLT